MGEKRARVFRNSRGGKPRPDKLIFLKGKNAGTKGNSSGTGEGKGGHTRKECWWSVEKIKGEKTGTTFKPRPGIREKEGS